MIRFLFSTLVAATLFFASPFAHAQQHCPKEEILIFGSAYFYSTTICNEGEKGCTQSASPIILVYPKKIEKTGCMTAPNCGYCRTEFEKGKSDPKKPNYVYGGRQIFADTTDGVSRLKNLGFAKIQGDKSDTHFALIDIVVTYIQKGKPNKYYSTPIAFQLPGNPGIAEELEAEAKSVGGEKHLIVTDAKTKKPLSYKIVVADGKRGVVATKLAPFVATDPMPEKKKPATKQKAKPTPRPEPAKRKTP